MEHPSVSGQDGKAKPRLIALDLSHNHFNFLRLSMALLVIWSHCFAIFYGSEDHEPVSRLLNGVYNSGNIAVRVFFVISGFLITLSYVRSRSLPGYLKKRVMRIYPGYIAAALLCLFVVTPLFSTQADWSAEGIGKALATMMVLRAKFPPSDAFAGHPVTAVNGALWSIPYEFYCYIGVIGLGLTGLLHKRLRLLVLAALLGLMAVKTGLDITGLRPGGGIFGTIFGWPYMWFSVAPCFLTGTLAYLYRDMLPRSWVLAILLPLALIASTYVSPLLSDWLFPPVIAYVTFFIAFSRAPLPDFAHFGDFSYGTYLYGFPIQQMMLGLGLPFLAYVPLTMLASLLAGVVSWFAIERRFLAKKSREALTQGHVPDQARLGTVG